MPDIRTFEGNWPAQRNSIELAVRVPSPSLRPLRSQDKLYTLENFGWLVDVATDRHASKQKNKKKENEKKRKKKEKCFLRKGKTVKNNRKQTIRLNIYLFIHVREVCTLLISILGYQLPVQYQITRSQKTPPQLVTTPQPVTSTVGCCQV